MCDGHSEGSVQKAVGNLQVCAGQHAGAEAAIHAMRKLYDDKECEAVLLVDASNAFNPQAPDGVYKPPHVYCRMGFINTIPFPTLHLSRNAAIVSESLKISDQHMAKRY